MTTNSLTGGGKKVLKTGGLFFEPVNRRFFMRIAGVTAVTTGVFMAGCKDDETMATPSATVDLGSGDTGILNYAYALEQLEAAFYTQVIQTQYSGITAAERQLLTDIRDHEIAHREFFKAALGKSAIQGLEVNFSGIDFTNRASVLGAAKTFEDLGVSAYNGAGRLLQSADFLLLAGKIVSVEARHASAIRSLLNPGTADFAGDDLIDNNGLEMVRMPSQVLQLAQPYVKTMITGANLPTA